MYQEIAAVLGPSTTCGIATSALPGAPVQAEPRRRPHMVTRRLLGVLRGHAR